MRRAKARGDAGGDTTTIDIQDREHVEREYATLVSRTHDRRSIPAGAIEQISVAIRLDKDALEKVVGKLGAVLKKSDSTDKGKGGGEVDDAVSAYLKTREDEIGKMLQLHGPVSVTVQPDILLATSGETETAVARSGGAILWASENALLLALLFVGFAPWDSCTSWRAAPSRRPSRSRRSNSRTRRASRWRRGRSRHRPPSRSRAQAPGRRVLGIGQQHRGSRARSAECRRRGREDVGR